MSDIWMHEDSITVAQVPTNRWSMRDTIYRDDAIRVASGYCHPANVAKELTKLPSAKPDIIRCKDCKHRYIENKVWTCPFGLPGGPEFFCGYGAKMEVENDNSRSN